MIRNYLVIAWRSLRKHLSYSTINILGLSLGFAIFILLAAWIRHEASYDEFNVNASRIYRGGMEYSFGGTMSKTSVSGTALLPTVLKNFGEVETGVRIYNPSAWNPFIVRRHEKLFQETRFYFADSTFFDVFSYSLLAGNPDKALTEPRSVVITESMARKYFGSDNPVGQILQINNRVDYTVTGVMRDVPSNSRMKFDFLASFSTLPAANEPPIWWSANYQTFLLLNKNADMHVVTTKVNDIIKKELAHELSGSDYVKYNFMPLRDIYLRSDVDEPEIVGSIQYVYLFGAIALLVVIIACINYVNLATARAADRAKEVGIRKVVGAARKQLFFQFIGESVIITFISLFVALLLAQVALPGFNALTGKTFGAADFFNPPFLTYSAAAALAVAAIAGAYPAIAMTSFMPVSILKGNFKNSGRGVWLRKSLVVAQFSVSIALIVATLIILKQIDYIQGKRLGYAKENVLLLPLDRKAGETYTALKTELLRSGAAIQVSRATEAPTKIQGGYGLNVAGGSEKGIITKAVGIDEDFVPALQMELIAGRNLTDKDIEKSEQDTSRNSFSFIVNESALKETGLTPENAIGSRVRLSGRNGEIIGVVKDFHFSSLHEKIGPLVLFPDPSQLNLIIVKLQSGDISQRIASVKEVCSRLMPDRPFEYKFLDQQYASLYSSEERVGKICTVFAALTIIIACLGLFGLVSFAAAQKVKEIGIRKVLGASVSGIVILITKDYGKLVLIAIIIGLPVAYLLIEKIWMSGFAYRTAIGLWPFVLSAAGCILIALLTASYQALRAARIDPVKTLRNE